MIRTLAAAFVSLLALAAAASAQNALEPVHPRLKAEATVTSDIVRIGDLVENAGVVAKVAIFRAPDLGFTGTVSVDSVVEAVRAHALIGLDTAGLSEVTVTRAARNIAAKDIEETIAHALSVQSALGPAKDIVVTFERPMRAMYVEASAKGEPRVARINFDARNGRFDATMEIPTGAATRGTLRLSGRAVATVEVATLSQAVERGAVLKEADVMIERRSRAEVGRDAVTMREQAVGMAVRTALQAGRTLRTAELMKPEVVLRNETVMLVYQVPGITLTVRGKASEGGAEGDVISVLNEQTKRTVQGVIVGPGRVIVSTSSQRIAANLAPARPPANANVR